MKKIFVFFIVIFTVFLATGASAYFWWKENTKPVSGKDEKVSFVIPKGASAQKVANGLYEKKLIKTPLVFKIYMQLSGKSGKIQPGEFTLNRKQNLIEIVEKLMKGPDEIWVVLPEGLRREEVAQKIVEDLEIDDEKDEFISSFLKLSDKKEGYLFPDSYLFPKDVQAKAVFDVLTKNFAQKVKEIGISDTELSKTVNLASLVERETKEGDERPIVAGIILKRIENDWPIQIDASVQYAVANSKCIPGNIDCNDWWPDLTKEDMEITSPFNSYKYKGLPPSPIANPGYTALKAAANPESTDYWYYIHDSNGKIHYAKTLEEHNQNVKTYLGK